MRVLRTLLAALLGASSALASAETIVPEMNPVAQGAAAFLEALGSDDRNALAAHMVPEAVIFIHDQMYPGAPEIRTVAVADFLTGHLENTARIQETMNFASIEVSGDMAHVWGPYRFMVEGVTTHCGINSLSMMRNAQGMWQVANISFTMIGPEHCDHINAPEAPTQ
jgi:ketosteroid isomerase-like protein